MTSISRWQSALTDAMSKDEKSVVFQLATSDSLHVPHVRSHIFRGFLSPMARPGLSFIVTSTDIRTAKISQMTGNPRVEIAWWIASTQEQFRIAGTAYIIPASSHVQQGIINSPEDQEAMAELKREGFDWEMKRRAVFDSMSGHMKATWCRPPPGSRLEGRYEETGKSWPKLLPKLGSKENERELEVALGNFALVVIEADDVDWVEMGVIPNRRTRFMRKGGEWLEEALVP